MTTFITSDLHFYHKGVMNFCASTRPWDSVDAMTEGLISHWNSLVSDSDTIYHLGDFAFANKTKTRAVLDRLNGQKVFIMGNHDNHNKNVLSEYGEVFDYKWLRYEGFKIALFHFPIVFWNEIDHGSLHFYGHMHNDYQHHGRSMDVGWDAHGRILTMDEAIDMVKDRPVVRRRDPR